MSAKDYVEKLDWASAIAAEKNNDDAEFYLYRGIAHCYIHGKEGKHKEAIEDLSRAITLKKDEAYYYRAYAYYLDGDYERAIADCEKIKVKIITNTITYEPCPYRDELWGKIYSVMGKYEEAIKKFNEVLKDCFSQTPQIPNPGLLDSYSEACKKMNRV
jgi:tetratricopeptide (TPR) repeat protein